MDFQMKKQSVKADKWCNTANAGKIDFRFSWSIDNFHRKLKLYESGKFLSSDIFEVVIYGKETAWKLMCYPNGLKEESKGTLGLFLLAAEALDRNLSFSIELVDPNKSQGIKAETIHFFSDQENYCGWDKFISHSKLMSPWDDLLQLPQGRITIVCVLTVDGPDFTVSGTSQPNSTFPIETKPEGGEFGLVVLGLLETGYMADVEVVCKAKTFSCHKKFLEIRSPVFRAALEKASGQITIENLDSDTVADMLTHIYGGRVKGIENKADKLLAASDQYDLKQLKRHCEELLARSLNISNCLDRLLLADLHSVDRLKPVVIGFIQENLTEVGAQDKWKEMQAAHPGIFLDVLNEIASKPAKIEN